MKHIKKYNESKEEIDLEYIRDCFIEFIDDPKYEFIIKENRDDIEIELDIHPSPIERDVKYSINKLAKLGKSLSDFYLDVENSIDKVKLKYPGIYDECEENFYTSRTEHEKYGHKYLIIALKFHKWLKK